MDILNPVKNKEIGVCRRCGRKLKTIESIELGMGSICYKKFMAQSIQKPLFKMRKNEVQNPEEPAFNIRGQDVIKVESADIKLHGTEEDKINENNS